MFVKAHNVIAGRKMLPSKLSWAYFAAFSACLILLTMVQTRKREPTTRNSSRGMYDLLHTGFSDAARTNNRYEEQEADPESSQVMPTGNASFRRLYEMGPPDLSTLREKTADITIHFIAGKELDPNWIHNYCSRFWFGVRCHLLGGFGKVRLTTVEDILEFNRTKPRDEDVILLVHRSKSSAHEPPPQLQDLRTWRDTNAPRVQIAVFHTANERYRSKWMWYKNVDFVLRNYWLPNGRFPPHVAYVPLHPQMPSSCSPESPSAHSNFTCSCGDRKLPLASSRRWLYSFSGSLRSNRTGLLKVMAESKVAKRGEVQIASRFGGDGKAPKVGHLALILDSAFVLAPCGQVMETHRIYEALALGAIPLVEGCEGKAARAFFPISELILDSHTAIANFIEDYADNPSALDRLQQKVLRKWAVHASEAARSAVRFALSPVPPEQRWAP